MKRFEGKTAVKFLNFFHETLNEDQTDIKDEFKLSEVQMNPSYVRLVERSLKEITGNA